MAIWLVLGFCTMVVCGGAVLQWRIASVLSLLRYCEGRMEAVDTVLDRVEQSGVDLAKANFLIENYLHQTEPRNELRDEVDNYPFEDNHRAALIGVFNYLDMLTALDLVNQKSIWRVLTDGTVPAIKRASELALTRPC